MTITKDTPVIPTAATLEHLEADIASSALDLRRPNPPRWLDEWINLSDYRQSDTATRRQIAAHGYERRALSERGDTRNTADDLRSPYERAPHGTPYVACSGLCGQMIRHSRPAVIRCHGCARRKPTPKPADIEWSTP